MFMQRANLHVLLNHRVLRLLPAAHMPGKSDPHFDAVEYGEIVDGSLFSCLLLDVSQTQGVRQVQFALLKLLRQPKKSYSQPVP